MKRIRVLMIVLTTMSGGLGLRRQQKSGPGEEIRATTQSKASANLRAKFNARWAQDQQRSTKQDLDAIEALYQEAQKQGVWGTEESVRKLRILVTMYKSADRVGCAYLYLGQLTRGSEREEYLKKAIAEYSDSMYGDGVQVGAYARFLLAFDYLESGRKAAADELFNIIRAQYPDAVDHSGMPLVPEIPK